MITRISDDELTALALAADPDAPLTDDAIPLHELVGASPEAALLPDWYMPPASAGVGARRGWRRRVAVVVITSLLAINAAGLCVTYGHVVVA